MNTLQAAGPDGVPIRAPDEGAGPTVLIVHGGSADASSWSGVANLLNDAFRVVRLERRLYAKDRAAGAHSMAVEAGDILAIAAKLPTCVLVGHSSGAVAALEAALARPTAFAALLLYEPPLAVPTLPIGGQALGRARAALDAGDAVGAMRIHVRDIVQMPADQVAAMFAHPQVRELLARNATAQIADDEAIEALGDDVGRYRALTVPVVLVEGEQSPEHLRRRLAALAAVLPRVERIVTLAGEGHIANLTNPARLAALIRDLARHGAA